MAATALLHAHARASMHLQRRPRPRPPSSSGGPAGGSLDPRLSVRSARLNARDLARQARLDDAVRLEPESEPLAVLAGQGVQARELLHALEPVADRVAVGMDGLRGRVHVAVV